MSRSVHLTRGTLASALVGALTTALLACGGETVATSPLKPTPTDTTPAPVVLALRKVAENRALRVRIGTAAGALFNSTDAASTQYMTVMAREFNALTPENEMKFSSLRPSRSEFRYARADSMVAFAAQNNMFVRGHTLAWYSQLPSWITSGTWTTTDARALLDEHITAVVNHYKGKLAAWDVVNEAFTDSPVTLRGGFWADKLGRGYIEQAFRTAFAADPSTPLYYNDYNIEGINAKSDSVYAMLSDLKARGVPVHGVGMQMHLIGGAIPDIASISANFARFSALGLKIQITEMDVRVPTPATSNMLATQAQNYRDVISVCLQNTACDMVVVWGFTDRSSWIPSVFPGQGDALLFDRNFSPKLAYTAVNDLLSGK